ncbi:MAG: hypothetical protein KDA84_22235, partial [Planctomycetaceae bacterium]|nr:hypothetical protein [Planctomycetaceae bacterium]
MAHILIPCPKCGSGLRLKDRTNLGKLGRCPKCANRFVLEEPEEVELELADASTPNMGTAAQWVPDSDETASQTSPSTSRTGTAVADEDGPGGGFSFITDPEPGIGIQVTTHPTIKEGMTFAEVSNLLGKPTKRKRMSEMAAQARKQGKKMDVPRDAAKKEYMVFQHEAGAYKLIFREDTVAEVHSQPDANAAPKATPAVASTSQRSKKNKTMGIVLGGVLGLALVGILIYATQVKSPPTVVENKTKEPPKINQKLETDKVTAQEDFAFAQKFTKEHFPTNGELITFERIPHGARLIIHLRPAKLWSDERKFAEFRAAMTGDVTNWMEAAIKKHCLFEPKEIEEALICLILTGRGNPPDVATRVKLVEPRKKSEFLTLFGGVPNNDWGYPVYIDSERAYLVERDAQTFAVAPAHMAEEMVRAQSKTPVSDGGIERMAAFTDKDRHVSLIFQPFDLRIHQEFLVAENVRPALNEFLDWLNQDDVETVLWNLHLGDDEFLSEVKMRSKHQWTPRQLERDVEKKLATLPGDLYAAVQKMKPQQLGFRNIIGRFPAMMKVFALKTLGGTGEDMAHFTTVLPAKAAPNLALGTLLAWDESTRTDFTKAAPTPKPKGPKLPDLIVDRLKLPMDVDFRRRPLQEAFSDIGEATHVQFDIDGDALKFAGYTKNMPQTF